VKNEKRRSLLVLNGWGMNNLNDTILLVASAQGALLFLGLLSKKTRYRISNISIGMVVFVITGTILFSWGSATRYNNSENAFPFWVFQSYWLLPLAFWLFLEVNTNARFRFKKKLYLLFLPAVTDIAFQSLIAFSPSARNSSPGLLLRSGIWFFFSEILPLISAVIVFGVYLAKLLRLKRKVEESSGHYSGFKRVFWIYGFLAVVLAVWVASAFYLVPFKIVEIVLVSLVFLLGYVAYFKPDFFEISYRHFKPVGPVFHAFNDDDEILRLRKAFCDDRIYLRSKLTIAELADELELPVKYISYLISCHQGKNFNDFVNAFRVREVISKMADPKEKHKTLLGMALDSGFNSKSSFNLVFKRHTGKTPSDFFRK